MKKKTQAEKITESVISGIKNENFGTHFEKCDFNGVTYNKETIEAIELIAEGFLENAKGLGSLAKAISASHVTIETMVKVGD